MMSDPGRAQSGLEPTVEPTGFKPVGGSVIYRVRVKPSQERAAQSRLAAARWLGRGDAAGSSNSGPGGPGPSGGGGSGNGVALAARWAGVRQLRLMSSAQRWSSGTVWQTSLKQT